MGSLMKGPARVTSWRSWPRWWSALGASLTASCLLTTSLDGLEGPPLLPDAGTDGGTFDGSAGKSDGEPDAETESGPAADGGRDASVEDGRTDDRSVFDAIGEDSDGAPKEPIPVAPTGDVVLGIAEHGDDVYWVQRDPNAGIVRAPKVGGPAAFVQMTSDAFDVAVDDNYVYWSTGSRNEVLRKALGSTMPSGTVLFPGAGATLYLAVEVAGRVYATGADAVTVAPRIDGGTSDAIHKFQSGAAGIALSGTDIFWSVTAGIVRGDDSPQMPRSVYASAPGEVSGIATDGQEIYWIAPDGGVRALMLNNPVPTPPREVCRASIGMGDAGTDGGEAAAIVDIAVDDEWVYFAEPPRRRISKCLKR
jgi:hypothetical protein